MRPNPSRMTGAGVQGRTGNAGFVGTQQTRPQANPYAQPGMPIQGQQPVYAQQGVQPQANPYAQPGMPLQGVQPQAPVQQPGVGVPSYGAPVQTMQQPTPTAQRPAFGGNPAAAPQSRVQSSQINIPDFLRRK